MKSHGMKKHKCTPHPHNECDACCAERPINSKKGRGIDKSEIGDEFENWCVHKHGTGPLTGDY